MTSRISDATRDRIAQAWPEILDALATGGLVKSVLAKHNVSRPMLGAYLAGNPQLRVDWDTAREQSADAIFEDALETANNRDLDYAFARNKIDTLKWAARIRNPRLYGDKAQLDVNVRTVDLTRIIQDANARLAAARAPRVLEGTSVRIEDIS